MTSSSNPDVVIIGGGIIGASIAWRLGRHGCRVTLCEAGVLGGEASWAGAGMLVPGSEFDQAGEALDFALHSLSLYPRFVEQLEQDSGESVDFSLCGSLELAATEEEFAVLTRLAQKQSLEAIPARELNDRVKGFTQPLAGAIFYPGEGQVDPRTVTNALRHAFLKRGVVLREQTRVVSLFPYADGVDVKLESGETISATLAVIAAGAWASQIRVSGQKLPEVFPVKGHLIGYQLPPNSLPHVLRFQHTYVVQRRTGYTISGASVEHCGFDRSIDSTIVAGLAERAHQLLGGLLPAQPDDAWNGFRPGVSSSSPVISQLGDTAVWMAYGHYRNGILLAPATAERVTAVLTASLGMD